MIFFGFPLILRIKVLLLFVYFVCFVVVSPHDRLVCPSGDADTEFRTSTL